MMYFYSDDVLVSGDEMHLQSGRHEKGVFEEDREAYVTMDVIGTP